MKAVRGLYAITPQYEDTANLLAAAQRALAGGVSVLQYRDKGSPAARRLREAEALKRLCADYDALFIINDDVELAAAVSADGVHVGKEDAALEQARARFPAAIIGVSCYNRLERAQRMAAAGADYVAFGRFFPSLTKPEAVQAEPALLQAARRELTIPIVAIGGIRAENGGALVEAGAHALAVIQGLFGSEDIEGEARRLVALF